MIGVETAAFPGQNQEEIDRLLHMVGSETISFMVLSSDISHRLSWVEVPPELNSGLSWCPLLDYNPIANGICIAASFTISSRYFLSDPWTHIIS
jgi:hypothetical protein